MNGLTEMANLADQHFYELTNNPDLTPEQAEAQANNLNSLKMALRNIIQSNQETLLDMSRNSQIKGRSLTVDSWCETLNSFDKHG
jgi:Tfp pilus assembly ATPase PilU